MRACLILLITIKTIYGFGLFQSAMPFHMQFEIPAAFPSMGAMPFPAIFNPMEAMRPESEMGEARGMDIEGPAGNVTTKNKTEVKDGFKVTTITSNGPGFHSYIKEFTREGNSTGNGTSGGLDLAKMMGGPNLFSIMQQLRQAQRPKKEKCKKCGKGKFCDPIFHLCRKKFSEGRTCMFQKQCGKSLRCQWGKCQKAKAGDPGTFCKANAQCNGDACCRNTPGSFHLMCIPRQAEGAICGLKKESVSEMLYIVKRSTAPTCSPCQSGLKCADTGDARVKRCVNVAFAEKSADEEEGDNPASATKAGNGTDAESQPTKTAPAPEKPNEDEMDDWKTGGGPGAPEINSKKEQEKEDEDNNSAAGEDENAIQQGDGNNGIGIKPEPKKKKEEEKKKEKKEEKKKDKKEKKKSKKGKGKTKSN